MTESRLSNLSLNIIQLIFEFLPRAELFEFHLTSKRIHKKYYEILGTLCFQSDLPITSFVPSLIPTLSQETLLHIIFLTKQHQVLSKLASLCISHLSKNKFPFSHLDFSDILVPNSDLSCTSFEDVNFSNSNLSNCNFSRCFISNCRFFKASLKKANFGSKIVTGHLQTITSLVISDNRTLLVSAGYDRLIKFWSLPGYIHIKTLKSMHNGAISAMCLSSDSCYLISAEQDIKIWDLSDSLCKHLEGHQKKVTGLSMSQGNGIFVSSGLDGCLKIWKTETGKCKLSVKLDNPALSIMMSPDGKDLISGCKTGDLVLYDVRCKVLKIIKTVASIRSVFINSKHLLTGNDEGVVSLRFRKGELIRDYIGHSDIITCVKLIGNFVFSSGGDSDCTIRKWDLFSDTCLDVVLGHSSSINSFVVYNDLVISAGKDKLIRVNQTLTQNNQADWVQCFTILDRETVAAGYSSSVRLWKNGQVVETLPLSSKVMSLSTNGDVIAIGCWDMKIYVKGEVTISLIGHSDAVISLQFWQSFLFSGSADGTIKIWLWQEGYSINTLFINSGYVHRVVSNGVFAIGTCGCSLTRIVIWDLQQDSSMNFMLQRGRVKALAISDDFFVTGGSENPVIELWNFNGILINSFKKHSEAVSEVVIFNDFIISAAEDKWIYVWDWRNDSIQAQYYGFVSGHIRCFDEYWAACESKGSSLQLYSLSNSLDVQLLWRTLDIFECRNSEFRGCEGLDREDVQELENYSNYIK